MDKILEAMLDQYMKATGAQGAGGGGGVPGAVIPAVPYAGGGDPSGFAQGNTLPNGTGGGTPGDFMYGDARLADIRRPRR